MQYISIRKLIIGVIIVVALAVVLLRGDQFIELVETLRTGAVLPLVFAVLSQLCKYFAQAFAYAAAFKTVGEHIRARDTLPLVFGTFFMNTIAPSLNTAGTMLVIDDMRKRGIPAGRATSAALLMQMSIESGFMFIMIFGFVILQFSGNLTPLWFLFGLFVVFLVGAMAGIMVIGRKSPGLIIGFLRPIENLVNRLSKRFRKGKEVNPWVDTVVESFGEAAGMIGHNPKKAALVFVFSVLASTCELVCFCLAGVAFGLSVPSALIGGYVVATLFAMISITPQGVGVVEAAVVVLLAAYGVSAGVATAIALSYRGLVFWMPFTIGAVLIHRTKSFSSDKTQKTKRLKGETHPDTAKRLEAAKTSTLLPEAKEEE
ncbi:MAG: flippase-like domain-containing protein [Coriobacteriales bacterium]|jgi:uncharacterized protein (TIRG00374 family)|nr:flippase-like domain-containing protein [Coriobacteriales bacterium]